MSHGYHHFFAYQMHQANHIENPQNYFIGGFVGDTYADEKFKEKLERVCKTLTARYGLSNYIYCWAPLNVKEPKVRTASQRFQTAVKKSENKTKKTIQEIEKENFLFGEEFKQEEVQKLDARKEKLKTRYKQ